jgi:pimeloyl-ACP methyl ester carboxylesterase
MKFTWFNLMPWPYLPDEFRQRHRSVWVDIPSTLYDPRKGHFVYHEYMNQLEYADALGFDGIGVNEHHHRLTAETALIWGKSEKLIPLVHAEKWKELIPEAQLLLIEAAGHMVPYEQPAAFAAAVSKFLG